GWWAASVDNNPSGVVHATAFPETQNAHKRRLHVWRRGWDGSAHPCVSPLAVLGAAFGVQIRSRRICRTEWVRPHTTLPDTTKGPEAPSCVWRRGWDGSAHPCASPLAALGPPSASKFVPDEFVEPSGFVHTPHSQTR